MTGPGESLVSHRIPRAALALAALILAIIMGAPRDARATSIPGYHLIDTILVPTTGGSVSSAVSLDSGVTYKLRASGTFDIDDSFGDAEYLFPPAFDYCISGGVAVCDYGIAIDDPSVGGLKLPFWGPFDASHQYTIDFIGLGAPLSFSYHDDYYPDNSGNLTVEIFAEGEDVPEPALPLLGAALLALRRGGKRFAQLRPRLH
jgi:hypothetical protein